MAGEAALVAARLRDDQPNGTIKRVVDEEAGVVLYCYKNGNAGGMTAVRSPRRTSTERAY
ncbi:hypothetical protein [Halogranum rubrum]|uniref:hypothetical protein n=1 Tax=Halogranum rubrum TaxID=553466 RepID=UPI000B7E42C3|nr:hypothetical protein [Halogranum rubrum]